MPLAPGDSFDRYTIEARLGAGATGEVYRAVDTRLRRRVALKILSTEGVDAESDRASAVRRLTREARAAAAFDHPNAIAIFDVGEVRGTPYLAMELIEGKSLRAIIDDGAAAVPVEQRVRWLTDAARALAAAHERGLVHRDIKPENVMVRADGVVKVLDFGIAHVEGAEAATMRGRGRGGVVASLQYMAPEQVESDVVDARADQFGWGVVAYELLAGHLPWTADGDSMRALQAKMTADPPSLASACPGVAASVAASVHKAIARSPRDRFDSMDDIIEALAPHGASSVPRAAIESTLPPPGSLDPTLPSGSNYPALAHTNATKAPRRTLRPVLLGALAGALVLGAAVLVARTRAHAPTSSAPPAASSVPTAIAIAITDLPLPSTAREGAVATYAAGLQALRDASIASGIQSLEKATVLDPSIAAAHLRLAWWKASRVPAEARTHFQRAMQLRWSLGERDQALLLAIEPYASREPADLAEALQRVAELARRFPNDAELTFLLARHHQARGDLVAAGAAFDRALALDPKFALALWGRGTAQEDGADLDAALASYAGCLALSSAAASCLRSRAMIHAQRGACADLEADARRMIVIEPSGARSFEFLARALFARGKSIETVHEALRQEWELLPPDRRPARELHDRAQLDLATGDFASAERRARDLERMVASASSDLAHAEAAAQLLDVYEETGRADRAADVAAAFLEGQEAWILSPAIGENPVQAVVPRMLAATARAGRISKDQFDAKRTQWLARSEAAISPIGARELWFTAYAAVADDAASARVALDALPRFAPLPPGRDFTMADALAGRVYQLAGDLDAALPRLTRGASTCLALDAPIADMRAHLHLGDALASKGDTASACAAYRVVLDRWGSARPRSVTADQARAHAASLRCPEH